MKTILCYGDSHTWGFVPGTFDPIKFYMERYPREKRWTGLLQKALGNEYYVIEEGLNGRTTNVDSSISPPPKRNGRDFLLTALYSHAPIDLVVLMLGTNDLKIEFNRTSSDVANGIKELLEIVEGSSFGSDMQSSPKILLVNPPHLLHERSFEGGFSGGVKRGKTLGDDLEKLAKERCCHYFDASQHVVVSEADGVHFDANGHALLAKFIQNEIENII